MTIQKCFAFKTADTEISEDCSSEYTFQISYVYFLAEFCKTSKKQFPLKIILQEQQQLLSVYQNLVVKQLVSQSKKQEEVDQSEEQDEEARSVRNELVVLTPQVKDLVLAQKKTAGTDD